VLYPRSPPYERSPFDPSVCPRGSCVTPGISNSKSVNRLPFNGRSLIARSSTNADTELGFGSPTRGASDTVIVSLGPATFNLNVTCVAAPTSTRIIGDTCGDIPSASARAEYSPGGSKSTTNLPDESVAE
jgi:hypothetical protein